ncbi:MAG: YopX family protein [Candidatus Gastranaerophilaceae bacterium]
MQDRFKLRVWDTLANKMTYNFMLGNFIQKSQTDYEKKDWVGINYEPDYICFNNEGIDYLVLMQPTGLRDKHGKLIYEGDIVKIFHVSGTMQGKYFFDVVEWNDLRCRFDTENYGIIDDDDVYEVIGNIYENPELLEG